MAYTKTAWLNNTSPDIDATNLNHIETGIFDAHVLADAAIPAPLSPAASTALVWSGSGWVASQITNDHVSPTAAIHYSKLNLSGSIVATDLVAGAIPDQVPPGAISAYGGGVSPSGWLICDGASYVRADYPDLFAAISTAYGAADGTHFNVPDLRGRGPVGLGSDASVNALGASDGVALANRSPKHNHTNGVTVPAHTHSIGGSTGDAGGHTHTGSTDNPGDHTHINTDMMDVDSGNTYNSSGAYRAWYQDSGHGTLATGAAGGHTHSLTSVSNPGDHAHSLPANTGSGGAASAGGTVGPGGTLPVDTPAFVVVNYIIKI